MTFDRWIGVHTGAAHYLDHLGILCEGLGIPLFVTESSTYEVARDFYPKLQVQLIDMPHLSLDFLAKRAEVIFESGHHFAQEMIPLWELLHQKKMRVVYCPHGNSDKIQTARKDISLVYGDHMRDHLQKTEATVEKVVVSGNFRFKHYLANQAWYDEKLRLFLQKPLPKTKQTILYAPTWPDVKEGSTWISHGLRVVEELSPRFNLLLRWHPFLDEIYPAESEKIRALCEQMETVFDLTQFPSIYPILNLADFYLGDFSSIGYDFLTQDKPLFFLDRHAGEIYDCGIWLKNEGWEKQILEFQDSDIWREKRKKLAKRVFKEIEFDVFKRDLKEALSHDRAPWIT